MAKFFETNIRFDKMMDNGTQKRVTEQFLIDALSVTEAENRTIEERTPYIVGESTVTSAKESNIAEVFSGDGDRFYKVKAIFITIDEKSGAEKRTPYYYLVQSIDFLNAYENFLDGMKGTVVDFEVAAISETKILEVYYQK